MSKFKVGEAKTKGGHEAYIFEMGDTIFGRIKDEHWFSGTWRPDGKADIRVYDLLPNNEPLRAEFEATVWGNKVDGYIVDIPKEIYLTSGTRVKVTLESLE